MQMVNVWPQDQLNRPKQMPVRGRRRREEVGLFRSMFDDQDDQDDQGEWMGRKVTRGVGGVDLLWVDTDRTGELWISWHAGRRRTTLHGNILLFLKFPHYFLLPSRKC